MAERVYLDWNATAPLHPAARQAMYAKGNRAELPFTPWGLQGWTSYDATTDDLKYVRANDANGTSWGTPVTVASIGDVGQYTSLAVVNGNPAISYYDATNDHLKYVRANNADGTSSSWVLYGTYRDALVRGNSGWRIRERHLHGVYSEGKLLPRKNVQGFTSAPTSA